MEVLEHQLTTIPVTILDR